LRDHNYGKLLNAKPKDLLIKQQTFMVLWRKRWKNSCSSLKSYQSHKAP